MRHWWYLSTASWFIIHKWRKSLSAHDWGFWVGRHLVFLVPANAIRIVCVISPWKCARTHLRLCPRFLFIVIILLMTAIVILRKGLRVKLDHYFKEDSDLIPFDCIRCIESGIIGSPYFLFQLEWKTWHTLDLYWEYRQQQVSEVWKRRRWNILRCGLVVGRIKKDIFFFFF